MSKLHQPTALILAMAGLLAACGGGGGAGGAVNTPTPAVPAPAPTPTAASLDGYPGGYPEPAVVLPTGYPDQSLTPLPTDSSYPAP